jgi:hypothetical protein
VAYDGLVLTQKMGLFWGVLAEKWPSAQKKMTLCVRVFALFEDLLRCKPLQGRIYQRSGPFRKNHT